MSRVLIVEDTAVARLTLAKLLAHEGHQPSCASNGLEALELLEQSIELPDVVLLDLMMPKMDGIKFLETIRSTQRYATLPVIVMTSTMDSASLSRIRGLGIEALMNKAGFDLENLLERLRRRAA